MPKAISKLKKIKMYNYMYRKIDDWTQTSPLKTQAYMNDKARKNDIKNNKLWNKYN